MFRSLLLAAAALWTLAACASTETTADAGAPTDRDCFNASSVSGFSPIDDYTVKISVGPSREYALTTQQRVTEIRFNQQIGLQATTNWICTGNGLGVTLYVPDAIPERYNVTQVTRLPNEPPIQGS